MTKGQELRKTHQKNEPVTIKNGVQARNKKENSLRNVDERDTHQHYLHWLQKVVHLSGNEKRLIRRKNLVAREVPLLHQIYRYRYSFV